MRIKVIKFLVIAMFIVIVADLVFIQVIRGKYFYNLSKNNMIRVVPLLGWRGKIMDRNGAVLADNRKNYNVVIMAQEVKNAEEIFNFLADILNIKRTTLTTRYQRKKTAPFIPVVIAENITNEQAIMIEENKYRFPGLLIQEGYKRYYPEGEISAHVLGYVGRISGKRMKKYKEYGYSPQSLIGYSGVEEYYDSYLRGVDGGLQIEVNSRGKQVRLLSIKDALKGQDIVLTIDKDIQRMAQESLVDKQGSIIVMDLENGELLGMANMPTYDPNVFIEGKYKKRISRLFNDQSAPMLNRAITGQYPPGSVFKIPVALAGLQEKKINPKTKYICEGKYTIGNIDFGCTHVHGDQSLIESIAHSCNVYYYILGRNLGAEQIRKYALLLGLGELTHIDLPFEKQARIPSRQKGLLSKKRKWYTGDTLNMSIGQGDVLTTPLQLVKMMATVANDGVEVQPHVIYSIGGYRVDHFDHKKKIPINKEYFKEVKKGMRATVTDYSGTAHVLDLKELYVAGKTGTAQTRKDKEHHAWFVGIAKGEKRDVAFCVFLEHGGSSINACLLAKEFLLQLVQAKKI